MRYRLKFEVGQKFGRYTITDVPMTTDKWGNQQVIVRCDCGTIRTIRGNLLQTGRAQSCGCYVRDTNRRLNTKHGHAEKATAHASRTYCTWTSMIQRCTNPRAPNYKYYGGRGVAVCTRWMESFEAFLGNMGERPQGKSLDRIDANGNYEPNNCRWATAVEQRNNQRRCHPIKDAA